MDESSAFVTDVTVLPDWVARRPIAVADYYKMADAGILGPDERTELIEGQIIAMAPSGSGHAGRVTGFTHLLVMAVVGRALVRVQLPVRLSDITEPEPDFAVVKLRQGNYTDRHPTAEDAMLLVEVSDSSLVYDTTVKASVYARHSVQELWIVDVKRRSVTVYRSPANGTYTDTFVATGQDALTIAALPGITFRTSDVFP